MENSDPSAPQAAATLALKVPPLVLLTSTAGLMWALPAGVLMPRIGAWHDALSVAVAGLGLAICLVGVRAFRQSRTTVDPRTPAAASSLVVGGIYRHTRNPMYLGFLLVLFAFALHLGKLAAFVLLPVFVVYLNELQIKPEESALRARFGVDYDDYADRVPRWFSVRHSSSRLIRDRDATAD